MLDPKVIVLSAGLFLFVWYIFGGRFLKPFIELLIEREERTEGDERLAAELRQEAHVLAVKVENALHEARLKGIARREEIINAAKDEAQRMITAAQLEAAEKLRRSREQLVRQVELARKDVESQGELLAAVVLERVLTEGSQDTVH